MNTQQAARRAIGMMSAMTTLSITLAIAAVSRADDALRLPALLSDHMVLQCDRPVKLWGWGNPGSEIQVTLGRDTAKAKVAADGTWEVKLPAHRAGGPHEIVVACGKAAMTVRDVLFGEVWLCGGQSNMQMSLVPDPVFGGGTKDWQQEAAAANSPEVRMFSVDLATRRHPEPDCKGKWALAIPSDISNRFSAVGYYFGRKLNADLKTPVGLLNTSWGGLSVESCVPADFGRGDRLLDFLRADAERLWDACEAAAAAKTPFNVPMHHVFATMFNGMMAPVTRATVRGFLWYQGETNADSPERAAAYGDLLRAMVAAWRGIWGEELPFLFVQVGPCGNGIYELWRQQVTAEATIPNSALISIIDVDRTGGLHPLEKRPVGERLALAAEGMAYKRRVEYSGPRCEAVTAEDGCLRLKFSHAKGLKAIDGGQLGGFSVAGWNLGFVSAEAAIEGDTVVVRSTQVPSPRAVRYGWAPTGKSALVNGAGLPPPGFEWDTWNPPERR